MPLEELAVADVAVVVDVVDLEGELELGHFVSLDAELADALDELLEVHLAVTVFVENLDDPLDERVPLYRAQVQVVSREMERN